MKSLTWRNIKTRYRYSAILLKELVRTDFKVRYQGSTLGYLWSLLRPLFIFIVLYFIFVDFLHIGSGIPHWPQALLLGMVMWNFFTEITNQGLRAIVSQSGVIGKINFPKYIIIMSASISALINLAFNLLVIAVFIAIGRVTPSWWWLLIPVMFMEIYVFAVGCAFVLSTLYVKFRDINFIWEIIIQAAFYASAVMFPVARVFTESVIAGKVLLMNPVAQAVQDARHFLLPATMPSTGHYVHHFFMLAIPFVIILLVLILGAIYFRRRSPYFAEEI